MPWGAGGQRHWIKFASVWTLGWTRNANGDEARGCEHRVAQIDCTAVGRADMALQHDSVELHEDGLETRSWRNIFYTQITHTERSTMMARYPCVTVTSVEKVARAMP